MSIVLTATFYALLLELAIVVLSYYFCEGGKRY